MMNRLFLRQALTLQLPLRHSSLFAIPSPHVAPPHRRAQPCAGRARAFASGGMFESLTSSMGATLKQLMGRKTLTKEEVEAALASVNDALVDADVAQVTRHPLPPSSPPTLIPCTVHVM